jgi:hypothetical protein
VLPPSYNRLIGKPPAEKPQLGKRKPLPEREVKTNVAMLLSLPVEPDLWNRANWLFRERFRARYPDARYTIGDQIAAEEAVYFAAGDTSVGFAPYCLFPCGEVILDKFRQIPAWQKSFSTGMTFCYHGKVGD